VVSVEAVTCTTVCRREQHVCRTGRHVGGLCVCIEASVLNCWRQKTRVPGLSCGVVCVILRLAVLVELRLVTDTDSALEVFLNDMRYINPRFTYLLTYLLTDGRTQGHG